MNCTLCSNPIPEGRLQAVPDTDVCLTCKAKDDDAHVQGHTTYTGKHGRELILSTEVSEQAFRWLRSRDRRRNSACLPFASRENPRTLASRPPQGSTAEFDVIRTQNGVQMVPAIVTNFVPAVCHPLLPSTGPSRLCVDCAIAWYQTHRPSERW